ncbi:SDR family oxidoreductase [Streptomyces sp. NBC_01515]|uniref:SDR family NAD(P)-dependent oxidoreductase n=1 Tax=Streptomyces sp. NBC_01515 TaxID=2903890 RepID=UPI0038700251
MKQVVVVLGASGGIGRAATAEQAVHGRHVIAVARGEGVAALQGGNVTAVRADASHPEVLEKVFGIAADTGYVQALVRSVLADHRVPLDQLGTDDMQQVVAGATSALKAALLLQQHRTGPAACVLVGSIHGGSGEPGMAAYTTAKAALRGLTLSLAVEWGPKDCGPASSNSASSSSRATNTSPARQSWTPCSTPIPVRACAPGTTLPTSPASC